MPSTSMSPMPMQSKIGDASLKFGPDWLRALSSDSSTSAPTSPWSGGSGGGGGTPGLSNNNNSPSSGSGGSGGNGFGGGGGTNYQQGYHQHQSYNSGGGYSSRSSYGNTSGIGTGSTTSSQSATYTNRFKPSEFRYSREEILSLYDKNLAPPEFLPAFGTLFVEKMQPPLAFSQPSEDELRVWHIPQPESSRLANMGGPPLVGRGGYALRGRGSAIERGRGRGRGGYYGSRPPYEEEERVAFSRPRAFERSLSAHERASWAERNGTVTGGQSSSPPEDGGARGGGSWRNRERNDSYGTKRLDEDDGWRKPRWRRDDDDDGSRRRLHKSWSEDGTHDNLPEWAKDSTDEREGGTFDSSGAFLEEEGYSAKTNAFEKRRREERERSSSESESHGSHTDRGAVQKKTPDRNSMKAVIPPSLKEEADESTPDPGERSDPSAHRTSRGSSKEQETKSSHSADGLMNDGVPRHKADVDSKRVPEHNTASNFNKSRNSEGGDPHTGKSHHGESRGRRQHLDEDQDLDMSMDATSLVEKLIDEDPRDSRSQSSSIPIMLPIGMSHSSPNIPNHGSGIGPNATMDLGRDRISPGVLHTTPPPSIDSMETWFYRDPQGNVQGPFRSSEMHQWFGQGYFTGGLLLRRECDKIYITLYEMGKLYGRNPFDPYESDAPPPQPIVEPQLSALEPDQFQQKQQHLLQQQNILREQKYLQSMNQNTVRNEPEQWGNMGVQSSPLIQSHSGGVVGQGSSEVPSHVQAQMILNLVKNAGANVDPSTPNPIEHLQALFNRQAQLKGGEPQSKAEFVNSIAMLQSQLSAHMEHRKAQPSASNPDAMQSLLQQLTALSAQQQLQSQMQKPTMPKTTEAVGSGWGAGPQFPATPQMQAQMPWLQQSPNQNSVWEYRDQMMKLQQQKLEEELRRKELRKLEEEKERKRLMEEEERRREEQKRLELEEEKRKMIEEQLKEKYLLQKKQQEEIMKQQAAELAAARRREEEKRLELEEEKRKALILQEQLMQKKQEEMMRQHQQQELERQRMAEMQRQQYEQQKLEQQRLQDQQNRLHEQQRLMEQQREQQMREEEQRRQKEHEELQRREREQREEQHRREREEQQRREREEQQRREQQNKFSWNAPPTGPPTLPIVQTRTLLEIQQEEAVKQQEEIVRQQVLKKKQLQQQQEQQRLQQQNSSFKWAQATQTQKVQTKSFTEIQAEEAAKLAQQQEKDRENRAIIQHHSQQQQMWSSSLTWANRASLNAPNTSSKTNGGGAWGDSSSTSSATKSASNKSQFPTVQQTQAKRPAKESDDNLMKLFQEHNMKQPARNQQGSQSDVPEDEFTRWCFTTVKNIANPGMDIPIFINFLKQVESPYDVNDYIVSYLGDGRDAREFGKEFLERRSRWRNANKGNKDSGGLEDNLCRPASAVNPVNSDFQEVKVKGKKGKKGKMQKVDSRILGFTTNAGNKRDYGGDSTD